MEIGERGGWQLLLYSYILDEKVLMASEKGPGSVGPQLQLPTNQGEVGVLW